MRGVAAERERTYVEPLHFAGKISIRDACYSYPNTGQPALEKVSLEIPKGASVGFVGSTGSGKTTLVNVILGLLKPQSGEIRVDGVDIYKSLPRWHASIGYIPQTIYLLDDTIRQNIVFGIPDEAIDQEMLRGAIEAAQLSEFVDGLENGLDTVVGERGVRISGGQRQRIGLARALYHQPEILIMDEGTSALDNQTENLVMDAIHRLSDGRTIIMVAHRLSTVKQCDRLYFMTNGRIEAAGTFDELSRTNVAFQRMAEVA